MKSIGYTERMKLLRLFLIALLTLSLPIYGQAAVDFSSQCTMQMDHGKMSHCCPECDKANGKMKHGHPCKFGQECKTCGAYQPVAAQSVFHPLEFSQAFTPLSAGLLITRDPGGFWRPPRSI